MAILDRDCLDESLRATLGISGADCEIRLFTNNIVPGEHNVPADFTEATFTDYLASVAGWGDPQDDGSGGRCVVSPVVTWTRGAGGAAETVYGWYLTKTILAGQIVLAKERYTIPRPMSVPGQTITLQIAFVAERG